MINQGNFASNADVIIQGSLNVDTTIANTQVNNFIHNTQQNFNQYFSQINNNLTNVNLTIRNASNAARNASQNTGLFANTLTNISRAFQNILSYGAVNLLFNTISTSIRSAVDEVIEFDKATEELQKVVGSFTNDELNNFSEKIAGIGERLSATMVDVTNAVTTFVKTGASLEESMDLAEVAIQMQHTADETLEASVAAESLISTMRAYPELADNAMHIADAINRVSEGYAISSGQIIQNLQKMSATMAVGNTTFEESLALLTGITEITRNASQAANALKTIGQRLRAVGEDAKSFWHNV